MSNTKWTFPIRRSRPKAKKPNKVNDIKQFLRKLEQPGYERLLKPICRADGKPMLTLLKGGK